MLIHVRFYLKISHFQKGLTDGMSCKYCGKVLKGGFNLRRHEKEYCPQMPQGEMSQSDSNSQDLQLMIMLRQVLLLNLKVECQQKGMPRQKRKQIIGYH